MDESTRTEVQAAAFRGLVEHLQRRTDVQNIDLMNLAGFCRNCLAKWYMGAAKERGIEMTYDQAREAIDPPQPLAALDVVAGELQRAGDDDLLESIPFPDDRRGEASRELVAWRLPHDRSRDLVHGDQKAADVVVLRQVGQVLDEQLTRQRRRQIAGQHGHAALVGREAVDDGLVRSDDDALELTAVCVEAQDALLLRRVGRVGHEHAIACARDLPVVIVLTLALLLMSRFPGALPRHLTRIKGIFLFSAFVLYQLYLYYEVAVA